MDDRINAALEGASEVLAVTDVALDEAQWTAGELLDALKRDDGAVTEVVDDGDVVAGFQQDHAGVATDVAGATGN